MHNIFFDPNQSGDSSGSSLWFIFPDELQDTIHGVVTDIGAGTDTLGRLARELSKDPGKYSDRLWMRVGSRRYVIYRSYGVYRMGSGGNDGTDRPYDGDEERLIASFAGLKTGG